MYKRNEAYRTPALLLVPVLENKKGVVSKKFPEISEGELLYCSFKSYGGTEKIINGLYTIVDTAYVETWFRPDITAGCRIALCDTNAIYEIINAPENVNMANQICKFKVQRIKGGA